MDGFDNMDQVQSRVSALQREWMQIKMEGLGPEDQDAVEEQQIVEDFMAAEQKKAATIVELDQYRKELDEMDLRKKEAVELIKDEVEQLAKITEREAQLEKNFGDTDPYECFAALKQTCTEREEELAGLYREIDQAEKEDQRVKERLRELQQRASNTIPVIIKNKDEVMRSMEDAWRMEKRKLYVRHQDLEKKQRQLAWHLNRGSYIKQAPKDPRQQGQFGNKGKVEVVDDRLKIWEDRLVRDHIEWSGANEDFKLQKIQVSQSLDRVRKDFEEKPANSKSIKPGSRADLDDKILTLKNQLNRENKATKDLVNENAELKSVKLETEHKIKSLRRAGFQLLDTYTRQQQQQPQLLRHKLAQEQQSKDRQASVKRIRDNRQ